jgi:GrpB-like predicted nucleotidyltransferase (UPF0157 family)
VLTHFIHIVRTDYRQWHNYINFRDYIAAHPAAALEYEALKLRLEKEIKDGGDYLNYHRGKQSYIEKTVRAANEWNGMAVKLRKN